VRFTEVMDEQPRREASSSINSVTPIITYLEIGRALGITMRWHLGANERKCENNEQFVVFAYSLIYLHEELRYELLRADIRAHGVRIENLPSACVLVSARRIKCSMQPREYLRHTGIHGTAYYV